MARLLLLALLCLVADAAPRTAENARWNVNVLERHAPGEYRGEWLNHSYFPSPEDWRALSIYQLLTDRFADGEPRNNELPPGGFDVRDMTYRHGGDLVGLAQKLSYIKGLGCRGIWISPVFQNGYNSYHQYSQLDFTLLDRRLGTVEDLRQLTKEAHRLGLYVIVDVVMNHMGNEFFFEGHRHEGAPWRFHQDEYRLRPRKPVSELHQTPAGRQPYMDFWYNNTWDPWAQYPGTVYGQEGEAVVDRGFGTFSSSDFHHNGDLQDYYDPFQIHYGKLYGTMDDLRLESRQVQAKYIAMTNALISSCDVDGFRVDTPMQVPLIFYKSWVPAVKAHARQLGKRSFGIFGEFYVTPERYATMTGRGKDQAMYGVDQYIEGPQTMKGGIVYSYYWYMFTAFIYGKPEFADGFALAYEEERNMLDTFDEVAGQKRYAMWNFCNNHDNWRMQSMTSKEHFHVCLVLITFWPGIPLHYAGDEQNFRTPGSALDGWAREELSASLAWQAVDPDHVLEHDNFDMTSRNYLFIARLNALRRAYFRDFGTEECDRLQSPKTPNPDVVTFIRGCDEESKILVLANFHASKWRSVTMESLWKNTTLQDLVEEVHPYNITVGVDGLIRCSVAPLKALLFAPLPHRWLPPQIISVTPSHGSVFEGPGVVKLRLRFDRAMDPIVAEKVALDGHTGLFSCLEDSCQEVGASVLHETLCNGLHYIDAPEHLLDLRGGATAASFRSSFLVDRHGGVVSKPRVHERPGLICDQGRKLCHNAAGARWLRIRDATGNWTKWRPYELQSEWRAVSGVGVLVQYHAGGSSGYIAGDCLLRTLLRCHSSWHGEMQLRGDFNDWGTTSDWPMRLVDHFTWAANFTTDTFLKAKFVPSQGWSQSYGVHPTRKLLYGLPLFDPRSKDFEVEPYRSGAEASRRWMVERGHWSPHQSMTTSADFASDVWISAACTPEPPPCPPPPSGEDGWRCYGYRQGENLDWCHSVGTIGCVTYALQNHSFEMAGCGGCDCCHKQVTLIPKTEPRTCCILFNDLLLNYTITPELSQCAHQSVQLAPSWVLTSSSIYQGLQGNCEDVSEGGSIEEDDPIAEEGRDIACASSEKDFKTLIVTVVFAVLFVALLFGHSCSRIYLTVVRKAAQPKSEERTHEPHAVTPEVSRHVLFASIEHVVAQRGVNCFRGETGAFLQDFIKEHPPGKLSMVHPMLGLDYGHLDLYSELTVVVDGKLRTVEVFVMGSELEGLQISWYFLRHELFLGRTEESLFPEPMSKIKTLRFYSLWNQSVAMLLEALKPEIYHSLDCHQALAPFYMEAPVPMVLLLRKPWDGSVEDSIGDRFWKTVSQLRRMSLVFNLKIRTIRKYCLFEGRFNMLSAAVRYITETQQGNGLCWLSTSREHRLLKSQRLIALGHPSRPVREEVESVEVLMKRKESARQALQQHAGLTQDKAQVLLFAGPWTRSAGVELLAEILPQILARHPQAQAILCGQCGDLFGLMAEDLLCRVMGAFPGRLCFLGERLELSPELRRGVHLLLAPSLSEPLDLDVELGFLSVPTVGCLNTSGRMPGIYFRQQNTNTEMLKSGFFAALDHALSLPEKDYWQLALAGTQALQMEESFGDPWQGNVAKVYDDVLQRFQGRTDQEHFDDRLWNQTASHEDLQSAMGARRSSTLRPVSSTADLAHQMQVLDIDDDAEFLTQPVSESRAQEIVKAVAESLPYFNEHMNAGELQRDISQARQRLQERSHMTRGLMKPFARGLCLRIHLILGICYVTSSTGEQLLRTLEEEGGRGLAPFMDLWCSFYVSQSLGAVIWLALSYGLPPNLLMTASQALSLVAFMLLPLLPEQADWSCLSYAAVAGVQNSSRLLFLLWNFNEDTDQGFQVVIWRMALLEGLRRSFSWLALLAAMADKLWIYKQVVFLISFTSLVLLFKAPICYATHVLPYTSWDLPVSFILLLLSEVCTSLGSYSQDLRYWLSLKGSNVDLAILGVILALPVLLHFSFSRLRQMQVWGPWPLRDFACFLPSGALLRGVAIYEGDSSAFLAAWLLSIALDALRYTAILAAMISVLGCRSRAIKGCCLSLCLTSAAAALAPASAQLLREKLGLEEELGTGPLYAAWALLGYVFQSCSVFFFNRDLPSFKGRVDGSSRWLRVAQVRRRMRMAKKALWKLQDRQQVEELALDQVQAVIEESFATGLPSLLISPKGGGKQIWETPKNQVQPEDESDKVPDEREGIPPGADEEKSGLPAKDSLACQSMVSFSKTELPVPSLEESHEDKEGFTTPGVPSVRSPEESEAEPQGCPPSVADEPEEDRDDPEDSPEEMIEEGSVLNERHLGDSGEEEPEKSQEVPVEDREEAAEGSEEMEAEAN